VVEEFGVAVDVMRQLKATLDPGNLMNPGKVV
jgi:FAD/FMN-containing dehydrogenase